DLEENRMHLGIPLLDPPYIDRYPKLATVTTGDPFAPEGNVIARNIHWGGRWDEIEAKARPMVELTDNLVDVDPKFVNAKKLDFALRKNSPAWGIGFDPIPVDEIGLYADEDRASWPVEHEVRPMVEAPKPEPIHSDPAPVAMAGRIGQAPTIDGELAAGEWAGDPLVIEDGIRGEKAGPPSRAWVARDADALYIAIENDLGGPASEANTWGQDDAIEIAIRDSGREGAPILLLRAYPNGHFESSQEAGATGRDARRAMDGVRCEVGTSDGKWTTEWAIPFESLRIAPKVSRRFEFNISVRKLAPEGVWLMWRGTGAHTWDIDRAGILKLAK
ncbi:MAG TPA: hypothetical protein QGH10_07825, partial [Armatimonadota bacterium]|nr:hypothetical protein [Armatimonadota bacterium]